MRPQGTRYHFLPLVRPTGLHILNVSALSLTHQQHRKGYWMPYFQPPKQAVIACAPVSEGFFFPVPSTVQAASLLWSTLFCSSLTRRLGRAGSHIRVQTLFHSVVSFRHHTQCDVIFRHGGADADSHKVVRSFRRVRFTAAGSPPDQHLLTARTNSPRRQLTPTVQGRTVADAISGVQVQRICHSYPTACSHSPQLLPENNPQERRDTTNSGHPY